MDQAVVHLTDGIAGLREIGLTGKGVTLALVDSALCEPAFDGWVADRLGEPITASPGTPQHADSMARVIVQAAPHVRLISVNVFDRRGRVTRPAIATGIELVKANHAARLYNISLEIKRTTLFCSDMTFCDACLAVIRATDDDKIVILAAGNRGPGPNTLTCPAAAPSGIRVGATIGPRQSASQGSTGVGESGTSVSAALVSGGCALLMEAFPDLLYAELTAALTTTATHLPLAPSSAVGAGRAHLYRAYRHIEQQRAGTIANVELAERLASDGVHILKRSGRRSKSAREESILALQQGIKLAPWGAQLHLWLARAAKLDNPLLAISAATEAIRLQWSLAEAHITLAGILRQLGDDHGCRVETFIAEQLENGDEAAAAEALFEGLRDSASSSGVSNRQVL